MSACARVAIAVALMATPAFAQTPSVVNGTLESRAVSQTVEREAAAIMARVPGPAWIGYAIPVNRGDPDSGCWSGDGLRRRARATLLTLEGPDTIVVLYRIEGAAVQRIRIVAAECPLDPGGLTLYWLTSVRPADSIDWLNRLAQQDGSRGLANSATMAIALHADAHASDALLALARSGKTGDVRSAALFWVAQRAADKAAGAITQALEDPETEVRKKAVFALTQLPKDEGVPKLIEIARSHRDTEVRRQAMFWLGQSRDPRALAFFEQVLSQ